MEKRIGLSKRPKLPPILDHDLSRWIAWYHARARSLPWRENVSVYGTWVSEIMLQQTQVATVVPYFNRWMAQFPTMAELANADETEVLSLWSGLGYYSRARNLLRGVKVVVEQGLPSTREGWLEVPGVGPYTAGAICSIALGLAEPIVDGNVRRVLSRLAGRTLDEKVLWSFATAWVQFAFERARAPGDFNQAVMELGATVCTPRSPQCGACPLQKNCIARARGTTGRIPKPKPRKAWVAVQESRACIFDSKREYVCVDTDAGKRWRKGLWDLPEVGSRVRAGGFVLHHVVTHHRIAREVKVLCRPSRSGSPIPGSKGSALKWVRVEDALTPGVIPLSAPGRKSIAGALKFLRESHALGK